MDIADWNNRECPESTRLGRSPTPLRMAAEGQDEPVGAGIVEGRLRDREQPISVFAIVRVRPEQENGYKDG
jgi:hypothetical protein